MISLVASDLEANRSLLTEYDFWDDPEDSKFSVSTTLIIVPNNCTQAEICYNSESFAKFF